MRLSNYVENKLEEAIRAEKIVLQEIKNFQIVYGKFYWSALISISIFI